jgi:hypothetical protein
MKKETITITEVAEYAGTIPLTRFFPLFLLAAFILGNTPVAADEVSAGFFLDRFKLTLEDGFRTEAAGPFYYSQQTDAENLQAFPPFFSRDRDPAVERQEDDLLYPLLTRTRYGHERRWQLFELLSTSSGLETDDGTTKRFTLFPIYFQQRAADTNLNYTAVVPFYGRLEHRLFRDEIYFILLPFYVETRKRDVVTDNYFFPFVDVRHGDGLAGWQFWPFAGREHKDVTTQTNGFGDVSLVAGHDQSFYLWPFYLSQDNGIGADDPETFRASIPFYAISRSPRRDSTTILWPFFTAIDDRGKKYREWQEPWPLVIFTRGEGKHTSRVFPLFSQSHNDTKETDSYLWPLYVFTRTHADPLDAQRTRILYILYSRLSEKNTETGRERIRLDMWPFFTWHHEFNGNERLQILAPLEPAVPDNPGIEHNWSPLWSVWRGEKNPKTGASSQSFLWNLYRRDHAPAREKVSFLFGLYQYQMEPAGGSLRLLYMPVTRPPR